jgi:hypothetical protein
MIVTHNSLSQLTILELGGAERLLMLLDKATLPRLRISIICTLWSLTGNEPSRRQTMACKINKYYIKSKFFLLFFLLRCYWRFYINRIFKCKNK